MPNLTKAGYVPPKSNKPEKQKKPAPKTPQNSKKKKKRKPISAAAVVSVLILLTAALIGAGTLFIYAQTSPYAGTFLPGTWLQGYQLAGAGRSDAEDLLARLTQPLIDGWQYELVWEDDVYTITAQDAALGIDAAATLDPLWAYGREGGMLGMFADMLRLQAKAAHAEPVVVYEMEGVDAILDGIKAQIDRKAVSATSAYTPGSSEPFTFTDEVDGLSLDPAPVRRAIEQALASMTPGRMELSPQVAAPAVRRSQLEEACVLRARVVMTIAAQEEALHNTRLAVQALSGAVIEPGKTLSFNELVGSRTAERGYLQAEEPAYGSGAAGVGGGVCAVSTALYRAALMADVEIVSRSAAVRPVDYCPMGQEAAVSGQGLDLVLRNDGAVPLYVSARTYPSEEEGTKGIAVEIQLIGEPLDAAYTLETQALETGVIEEPVYVRDRDGRYATYTDEKVPVGGGEPGYSALVERVGFNADGAEISRETVSEDSYDAVAPSIFVGVRERAKKE